MEFLKKHYEKIVLSVVLLALAVGAFLLTVSVQRIKTTLEEQGRVRTARKKEPVKPIDLSTNELAHERLAKAVKVHFAGEHNLANPRTWIEDKNKNLIREEMGRGRGARGLSVSRMIPLFQIIGFEGVAVGDDVRYQFRIEKQYAKKQADRRPTVISTTLNNKTSDGTLTLREVRGNREAPDALVVELGDGDDQVTLARDKPFSRVMGYAADLRYELERKDFLARRVDDSISLEGVAYKIVAITKDEVVVSDPTSQKRTIIRANTAVP